MDNLEAKILIKNLLQRFQPTEHGYQLSGDLTFSEYEALQHLLANNEPVKPQETQKLLQDVEQELDPVTLLPSSEEDKVGSAETEKNKAATKELLKQKLKELKARSTSKVAIDTEPAEPEVTVTENAQIELFTSVLSLPQADSSKKLCIDFGTAMSKVTLITDNDGFEEIEVLPLGDITDQEEISSTMLISSVYISNDGDLLFGKKALNYSRIELTESGEIRGRIDNIKRVLTEEGISNELPSILNPTNIPLTNRDMVLAYLMYLTWAIRKSLEELDEARNIDRRFAMPCLDEVKSKRVKAELSTMLGEAQILADTFYDELEENVTVSDFQQAIQQLKEKGNVAYPFIKEGLTEPLGVANTLLSNDEDANTNSVVMIIDVGAGTTDFSMYRMGIDNKKGQRVAFEVVDSSGGVQEAGSSLDRILKAYILNKVDITPLHAEFKRISSSLDLDIQNIKEQLFNDKFCFAILANDEAVEVGLEEFLSVEAVKKFSENLKNKQLEILENVAKQFVQPAPRNVIAIVITGGGANLPMVDELADRVVDVNGITVELKRVKKVPQWIAEEYEDLEAEYPRLAVSIGGARQKLIEEKGTISTTANVSGTPTLEGSYAY